MEGNRFIYNNVVLLLQRILKFPPGAAAPSEPRASLPAFDQLSPLDDSGAWVLEASILLERDPKPELVTRGTRELLALQAQMKGVVTLAAPERLALDTRVK
ncbi:MAG: hypothetical protein INR71_09640 [Terriglobus roseus]|nr:hypothetical protein [Terriglobus roseus]